MAFHERVDHMRDLLGAAARLWANQGSAQLCLRHGRRLVQLGRAFPILCNVLVRVDVPENRRLHFELLYVDGWYRPLQVGLASVVAPG